MSYMNDPREMAIRPESGVTLEQDNRVETMYHWGAMVTDLCDLPVSEYMKPITVIVYFTIVSIFNVIVVSINFNVNYTTILLNCYIRKVLI